MTGPDKELRPCPFCNCDRFELSATPGFIYCYECGITVEADNWNSAYCWQEIDRLKEELKQVREKTVKECAMEAEASVCAYHGYETEQPEMVFIREEILKLLETPRDK